MNDLLALIRPAVRAQRPYLVGAPREVDVKLNQNESPYDLPEDLKRALVEAFLAIPFNRYPSEQPDRLVAALAEREGVAPEQILVGNGSNDLTYTLGLTFVGPGTPVVLPRPMFSLYEKVVRLYDGVVTPVAPRADLSFDTDALVDAMRRTRAPLTIVTTPNNPTGRAMPFDDVVRIVTAAPGFVVVDEAYVEFNDEPTARGLLADHPNVIVVRTLSKAFGLAGLRVGYLVARPEVIAEMTKSRLPFMVDRLAETTALALLARPDLLAERVRTLKAGTHDLAAALAGIDGVETVPTAANFLLFKTDLEPAAVLDGLAEAGVLVRDMSGYPDLQGYLRVNAGTPNENNTFVDALTRLLRAPVGA